MLPWSLRLTRLLLSLAGAKALAAATTATPATGSVFKLALGLLGRSTVPAGLLFGRGGRCLGSAGRAIFSGFAGFAIFARLAGFIALAVGRQTFKVGRVFLLFHKVGDVKERVAFQAQVYECGLHTGEHPGDSSFVNGPGERVLIFALVIDLCELFIFKDGQTRLMRRAGNTYFFCHTASLVRRFFLADGRRGKSEGLLSHSRDNGQD